MIFDSDILIGFLRGDLSAKQKIEELKKIGESLQISVITACELWQGIFISSQLNRNAKIVQDLLSNFTIIDFNYDDAIQFGRIYAILQEKGEMIGTFDIMIASTALRMKEYIVTHNVSHFNRIPLLKIEDWKNKF